MALLQNPSQQNINMGKIKTRVNMSTMTLELQDNCELECQLLVPGFTYHQDKDSEVPLLEQLIDFVDMQ